MRQNLPDQIQPPNPPRQTREGRRSRRQRVPMSVTRLHVHGLHDRKAQPARHILPPTAEMSKMRYHVHRKQGFTSPHENRMPRIKHHPPLKKHGDTRMPYRHLRLHRRRRGATRTPRISPPPKARMSRLLKIFPREGKLEDTRANKLRRIALMTIQIVVMPIRAESWIFYF